MESCFLIWADAKLVFRSCPSEEWPLCLLVHPLGQINRPPTDAFRGGTFFSFGQNIVVQWRPTSKNQRWTCQSFASAVDPNDKNFLFGKWRFETVILKLASRIAFGDVAMTTVESLKRRVVHLWDRLTFPANWQRPIRGRGPSNRPRTCEFHIDLGQAGYSQQCYYNSCLSLSTGPSINKPATPRPLRKRIGDRPAVSCHELATLRSYRETHFPSRDVETATITTCVELGGDSTDSPPPNGRRFQRSKSVQTISSDNQVVSVLFLSREM